MPAGPLPTGTVTFMFTDIEGSTKLWEAHPAEMRIALARHDALMREAIESADGYVFKTVWDAFCAAFTTAPEAVSALLAAQLALVAEPWPESTPIRVRIALHTGVAESRAGDYFGPCLNRLARILSAAHGGQSLVSDATRGLIGETLTDIVTLSDLGFHRFKDLATAETVWQLRHPSLPWEFPALNSLDNQPTNLPLQLTSFIGRRKEMDEIEALLAKTRLLTLTGRVDAVRPDSRSRPLRKF